MLFWNKVKLRESGIFKGFTDWHSHILPGVDDGLREMEDSLRILSLYDELGVSRVWCTPHIMEDIPNAPSDLKTRFGELREAWQGNVELHLAAENMMDTILEERLESRDLLPLGSGLLVETSFFSPPIDMEGMLERVRSRGYFPVLAHPERYGYMTDKEYENLKRQGVLFHLIPGKAEKFLKRGWYDLVGLDLHSYNALKHILDSPVAAKTLALLGNLRGAEVIEE